MSCDLTHSFRVLIATIKNLGRCPCPSCLVKKADIPKVGTVPDMKTRTEKVRVDDEHRRYDIETARRQIFENGTRINSDAIDNILGGSGVPTRVSFDLAMIQH